MACQFHVLCHFRAEKWINIVTVKALTFFFFFFGDHPNLRPLLQIRTLGSVINPATAFHRPAFLGHLHLNVHKFG